MDASRLAYLIQEPENEAAVAAEAPDQGEGKMVRRMIVDRTATQIRKNSGTGRGLYQFSVKLCWPVAGARLTALVEEGGPDRDARLRGLFVKQVQHSESCL